MKESHVHLTGLWKLGLPLSHEHHYPGLKQKGLHAQHAYRQSQKQERFFALRTESVSGELNLLQPYAVVQRQSEWNGKESHACLTCFWKLGLLLPHALGWNRQVQSELINSESHLIWHVFTSWVCLWHLWFTPPLSHGRGKLKRITVIGSWRCEVFIYPSVFYMYLRFSKALFDVFGSITMYMYILWCSCWQ